jgi:segregation and condensation protein B
MDNIKSRIESLLFVSAKPMSLKQLAELIEAKTELIAEAGDELVNEYKDKQKGIQIVKNNSQYQMVSSPENSDIIKKFIKDETTGELSRPSLETLTIIAYRGPINKLDLERIRGVNCSLILRNLLLRGLIETNVDKQKKDTFYSVTIDFIRFLGINDVKELPDFEKLSREEALDNAIEQEKIEQTD